jgi:hypothetical protein
MTTPSSIPSVIEQQTRWARSKGFKPKNAYLPSLADNLRQELSDGALADFQKRQRRRLRERGIRPEMNALRSSAALSANVFDYWRSHDPAPLKEALGLREKITRVSFKHFSTGLRGDHERRCVARAGRKPLHRDREQVHGVALPS